MQGGAAKQLGAEVLGRSRATGHLRREVGLVGGLPIVVHRQVAQKHHGEHAGRGRQHERRLRESHGREHERAAESGHRVEVRALEHARRFPHRDIAQSAAAHAGKRAQNDHHHEALPASEGLVGPGQCEQGHRERVGEEQHLARVAKQPPEVEHEHRQADAYEDDLGIFHEVDPVILQQQIADDAAAVGRHEAQHNGAHDIEFAIAREHSPSDNAHGHAEEVGPKGHLQRGPVGEELLHTHPRRPKCLLIRREEYYSSG